MRHLITGLGLFLSLMMFANWYGDHLELMGELKLLSGSWAQLTSEIHHIVGIDKKDLTPKGKTE